MEKNLLLHENLFEKNISSLVDRFPEHFFSVSQLHMGYSLVFDSKNNINAKKNNIYLYPKNAEEIIKKYLSEQNIEKSKTLYVYGTGLAYEYIFLEEWLKKDAKRNLIFLEDDKELFTLFLHTRIAKKILDNKQAHIYLINEDIKNHIESITNDFCERETEVIPSWLYHKNKKKELDYFRLDILKKSALSSREFYEKRFSHHLFSIFVKNTKQISSSFYVNKLKNICRNIPAIICGAGPSLQDSLEDLSSMENKALIMAGGSAITATSHHGINPHIGTMVDPNYEEYKRMRLSMSYEMPIFYTMRLFSDVFSTMNGLLGYISSVISSAPELWLIEELGLLKDGIIAKELETDSFSVTQLNLSLANFLGCNPIILCGVDLSYLNNSRYVKGVGDESKIEDLDDSSSVNRIIKTKNKKDENIQTNIQWMMEANAIKNFAQKQEHLNIYTSAKKSLDINNISYMSLFDFKKRFCEKQIDLRNYLYSYFQQASFPKNTKSIVEKTLSSFFSSLKSCENHIRIILEELNQFDPNPLSYKETGKMILADIELKEEIAYDYLLHDIEKAIEKELRIYSDNQFIFMKKKWEKLLKISLHVRKQK